MASKIFGFPAILCLIATSPSLASGQQSDLLSTYGDINSFTGLPATKRLDPNAGQAGRRSSGGKASSGFTKKSDPMTNPSAMTPGFMAFPGGIGYASKPTETRPLAEMSVEERRKAEEARENRRKESLTLAERGLAFYMAGDFLSAAAQYGWAIDRDPTNPRLHYCRGVMYSRLNRFGEAISDFLDALQIDPELKEARVGLDHAMAQQALINAKAAR